MVGEGLRYDHEATVNCTTLCFGLSIDVPCWNWGILWKATAFLLFILPNSIPALLSCFFLIFFQLLTLLFCMWALLAHFPSSKWMFIIIKNNERWVFSFQSIFFHFSGLFIELPKTKKKKIRINSIEKKNLYFVNNC